MEFKPETHREDYTKTQDKLVSVGKEISGDKSNEELAVLITKRDELKKELDEQVGSAKEYAESEDKERTLLQEKIDVLNSQIAEAERGIRNIGDKPLEKLSYSGKFAVNLEGSTRDLFEYKVERQTDASPMWKELQEKREAIPFTKEQVSGFLASEISREKFASGSTANILFVREEDGTITFLRVWKLKEKKALENLADYEKEGHEKYDIGTDWSIDASPRLGNFGDGYDRVFVLQSE